jgi:pimeloyl-ACP methyl ester carboxylesterase
MTTYHHVELDGHRVFFRQAGRPDRPALLLLHGFPASSFMYRELLVRLADRFHLVAPDYPGFGHSEAPAATYFDYSFDGLTHVVERLVDHLALDRYGVYMQDFGGPVGFRLAVRAPERITFLVVQNANAYEEGLPDAFWAPARALWDDPSPANHDRIRELAMSDDALEWNYTHGTLDPTRIDPDSWLLQRALLARPGVQEAMVALLRDYGSNPARYPQWQEYLRDHQPPTLVLWGRNDVIFPEAGAHPYKRDLASVDFHLLDTGHFALEDHAEVIAEHIDRFATAHGLA